MELRGAGACSREVRNFAAASRFEADRLIAVEVLTPGGNWGSYPPHKHDEIREGETELEEIYHYVVADGPTGPGLAYQHIYGTADRPIDLLTAVATGDTVLVPHGWHRPAMAAPGYDLYYLNVMAGPGERAWRAPDDPAHAWLRETWAEEAIDPVMASFGSVDPPEPGLDELRRTVLDQLGDTDDLLGEARIAVRRGDSDAMATLAGELRRSASAMDHHAEALQ